MRYLREKYNVIFTDFPYLVRLNPNIPWKTRGNASIRLSFRTDIDIKEIAEEIWQKSLEYVEEISKAVKFNRKPGIAITFAETANYLNKFYEKAVKDVVTMDLARKIAERYGIIVKGDRGIIGSIASLGFNPAVSGYTYEILTYRNDNEPRRVDEKSVIEFDEKNFPHTFANYDYIEKKIQIVSHGEDPVLYGVRGTDARILIKALEQIKVSSKIFGAMLFKTNQATNSHISRKGTYYQTVQISVTVKSVKILQGGDVLVNTKENIPIIFYKETGELNEASKLLREGDEVLVTGCIKPSSYFKKVIEAESIKIINLNSFEPVNPRCPKCGSSTESLGKNKGFRCRKCGYKFPGDKQNQDIRRGLLTDVLYQSRKYRHLTRPIFLESSSDPYDIATKKDLINYLLYYHN